MRGFWVRHPYGKTVGCQVAAAVAFAVVLLIGPWWMVPVAGLLWVLTIIAGWRAVLVIRRRLALGPGARADRAAAAVADCPDGRHPRPPARDVAHRHRLG